MSFFNLNVERCKKDGICSKVCIVGIIKNDENHLPYIDEGKDKYCMACGLCVSFCPTNACYVEKLDSVQFTPIDKSLLPSGEQTDLLLKSRRSIRTYKKTPVDNGILAKVLDTVRYAPTAKNTQKIRWIITKNIDETDKIRDHILAYFQEKTTSTTGPELIMIKTMIRAYKQGKDVFLRGAPQIVVAVIPKEYKWREDAAIALTYFEISAFANGLGTCWGGYLSTALRAYKPLSEALGINEDEYVGGAVMLGNPIYKPHSVPSRNPINLTWI